MQSMSWKSITMLSVFHCTTKQQTETCESIGPPFPIITILSILWCWSPQTSMSNPLVDMEDQLIHMADFLNIPVACSDCNAKNSTIFCKSCQVLLCGKCQVTKHLNHEIIPSNELE